MRRWISALALTIVALPLVVAPAFAADPGCPPSPPLDTDLKLPHLAGLFAARRPVRIVAIGALSTAGNPANGTAGRAYPERLREALIRRVGPMDITVLNKGVARQSAAAQLARFAADVYANKPDIVIWETGTNDAVSSVDRDAFAGQLEAGIQGLRAHGIDVVLMNPQYSPKSLSLVDFGPYIMTLSRVAEIDDVMVFDRYALMHDWMDAGYFPVHDVPDEKRGDLAASIYGCVAERLADLLIAATR